MFTNFNQVEIFLEQRKKHGIKPGLDRMERLLALSGNPHQGLKAIHVAGTNGKGSTIRFMDNALRLSGYHVGVFVSPSMEGVTGHMMIDGKAISKQAFLSFINQLHPFIQLLDAENNQPSEFEIITVIAFMHFTKNVDIALIETGMGGREDTTNCFTPLLSIITNVEKDHIAFLGKTIEEIARHKAGIIKENIPVIVGDINQDAAVVIEKEVLSKRAEMFQYGKNFSVIENGKPSGRQTFRFYKDGKCQMNAAIRMFGRHQLTNASLAIMAMFKLEDLGYFIDWSSVLRGIENTTVPGRFEIIHENPVVILDGAHNAAGIKAFLETVVGGYKTEKKHLVFAAFKDKDVDTILTLLNGHFASITLTTFDHPRAARPHELAKFLQSDTAYIISDWKEAIGEIVNGTHRNDYFFITGSLEFISRVRHFLEV